MNNLITYKMNLEFKVKVKISSRFVRTSTKLITAITALVTAIATLAVLLK